MRFLELGSQGVVTYVKTLIRGISSKDAHQKLFASFLDCNRNRNGHTNHGVVACADETHHLCAVRVLSIFALCTTRE